uniref:Uncharacterized protein n=1 Tax=Triticum urartu TaxID=4572 RepID=A0A8R7K575_TRIUA
PCPPSLVNLSLSLTHLDRHRRRHRRLRPPPNLQPCISTIRRALSVLAMPPISPDLWQDGAGQAASSPSSSVAARSARRDSDTSGSSKARRCSSDLYVLAIDLFCSP